MLRAGVEAQIADHAWAGYQHQFAGNATRAERTADDVDFDELDAEVAGVIDAAVQFADESPFPDVQSLYEDLYA